MYVSKASPASHLDLRQQHIKYTAVMMAALINKGDMEIIS